MLGAIRKLFELAGLIAQDQEGADKVARIRKGAQVALKWMVAVELLEIIQIYPLKYFIDGISHGRSLRYLLGIVVVMLGIDVVVRVVNNTMNHTRHVAAWRQYTLLLGFGHTKQLEMDVAWHVEHGTYEKESLIAKNLSRIDQLTDRVIYQGLPVVIRIALTLVALLLIEPVFALFAAVIVGMFISVMAYNGRYIRPLDEAGHEAWMHMHTRGSELASKARTLKQFGVEGEIALAFRESLEGYSEADIVRNGRWRHYQRRAEYVLMLAFMTMYGLFALLHSSGRGVITVGSVVLVIEWLGRILINLYQFRDVQRAISEGSKALEEYCALFGTTPSIRQAEVPKMPEAITGRIELRGVNYCYPGNDEPTLHGLNLVIEPNTTIALVGPSGGGKSTVVALLAREVDPTAGDIFYDGVNLRQFDYDYLRQRMVGMVAQDVQLMDGTIAENIRIGNRTASDEQVQLAAHKAHADEFIDAMPLGYGTQIGENGVRLSGGQRQRLAIARVLVRQPTVLILDEATSALDAESQHFVMQTVEGMIERRESTNIIIAHRLSTTKSADNVAYMEDGHIAEYGTHDELMALDGRYAAMVRREVGEHLD